MKIKKDRCRDSAHRRDNTGQAPDTGKPVNGSAKIAVANRILIAMTAQALADNYHILGFMARVQFIADKTATATADERINEVRGSGNRPLIWINLCATDVTDLSLGHLHLAFSARRMLLFWKMVLAETVAALRAASKCLLVALVAATSHM